jgi:transposase
MKKTHPGYPSDVSNEEWAFAAPCLTLIREAAPQREYPLGYLFNAVRYLARNECEVAKAPNSPRSTGHTARFREDSRTFNTGLRVMVRG